MLRSVDLDVANVPGLDRPAYVGDARIDGLWAVTPPGGSTLSVTLVSHAGTCCIGPACDRAAVALGRRAGRTPAPTGAGSHPC